MNNPKFKALPVTQPNSPPPQRTFSKPDMSGAKVVSRGEARAILAKAALNVPNPDSGVRTVVVDDTDQSSFLVPIDQIQEYEHNPRRRTSDALASLKESIAAKGIQQVITVTKRPGQSFYIPYSGGNSRLRCAKELYAERSEANDYKRFAMIRVIYRTYTSESDIFAAHIAENEVRSDIPFWDKARAAMELKRLIENEIGRSLSARELEQSFASKGIPGARASLNYFSFAHTRLAALGEAGYFLSRRQVREHIQRAFVGWDELARKAGRDAEYRNALEVELTAIGTRALMSNALETATLIGDVETALANFYSVERTRLQRMLSLQDSFGDLSFDQLLAQSEQQPRAPREPRYAPQIPGLDPERRNAIIGQPPERAIASGQRALIPPMPVVNSRRETSDQSEVNAVTKGHADTELDEPDELDDIDEFLIDIRVRASELLQRVELASLVLDASLMPLGFIVDAPSGGLVPIEFPSDDGERQRLADRHYCWWVVSMLCAQHPEHGRVDDLPDCTWKSHITGEANPDKENNDDISYCQHYLFSEMGGEPTLFELYRFALDPDPSRNWVRDLLSLQSQVGRLVALAPQRFADANIRHDSI